jgi:hypothetical protein
MIFGVVQYSTNSDFTVRLRHLPSLFKYIFLSHPRFSRSNKKTFLQMEISARQAKMIGFSMLESWGFHEDMRSASNIFQNLQMRSVRPAI